MSPSDTGADTLDLVAEAILSYLDELDGYRATCLRHEATAGVYRTDTGLHLVRSFPWSNETLAHVRRRAQSLPGWERSPFWPTNRTRWTRLLKDAQRRNASTPAGNRAFVSGIAWEGRPALIRASGPGGKRFLRLELLLPPYCPELPELPLRTVATGLLCHEHLLSGSVTLAIPLASLPSGRLLSPQRFLKRAMPKNLCASQCFSPGGAEQ